MTEIENPHPQPAQRPVSRLARIWHEVRPILMVILVLCVIRSTSADWYSVPTGSMKPTILEGERIFVNKMAFDVRFPFSDWILFETGRPQRGEVVIFDSPRDEKRLVKRVVGLPGDRVELRDNHLLINGQALAIERLDAAALEALDEADRPGRVLAEEKLGSHAHPIMITPARRAMRSYGPVQVPEGRYLVLGDNRDESDDSRFIGFIQRDRIHGRALAVVTSCDPARYYLPRWGRFFGWLP